MKKKVVICVLVLGIVLLLLVQLREARTKYPKVDSQGEGSMQSEPAATDASQEIKDTEVVDLPDPIDSAAAEAKFLAAFKTPIAFFGKVVDQGGNAVSNASVRITLSDKAFESGSTSSLQSDGSGFFSIEGNGAAISIDVSKDGYYQTGESKGVFRYATANRTPLPTKLDPAVFVLHEQGKQEELIEIEARFRVSKNGTPLSVDLVTGERGSEGQTCLTVKAWTYDDKKNDQGRYSWKVNLSVNDGGLFKREERFDFVAPEISYNEIEEIVMSPDDENWSPQKEKDYFVKLGNGNYARIRFRMIAGGDNFFTLKSWYNPSGSTNLE